MCHRADCARQLPILGVALLHFVLSIYALYAVAYPAYPSECVVLVKEAIPFVLTNSLYVGLIRHKVNEPCRVLLVSRRLQSGWSLPRTLGYCYNKT